MKNIRKFDSTEAYEQFRKTDGWDYPNVSYVETPIESQVHYNNEFIMRWNDEDTAKTPTFLGDVSLSEFKDWVDGASKPCEIKKDGTDFAYLKMDGNNVASFTTRADNSTSHYSSADKEDYLQMTEIENINVGLFQDSKNKTKEVRFNFDEGCPAGFHKWFPNTTTGKKLWGRYDLIPVDKVSTVGTNGLNCCAGVSMGTMTENVYAKENWSANYLKTGINLLNTNLDSSVSSKYQFMEMTYWEHLVLTYIFCAYNETFNTQSIYTGRQDTYTTNAGSVNTGVTDATIMTHKGTLGTNSGYKFMHMEDPLHGKQWIWGAGWRGEAGKYYMTFDDKKANLAADLALSNADVEGDYPTDMSGSYISKIDVFGVPTAIGASSESGFYDGGWSNAYGTRVAYLGGISDDGAVDGAFARTFSYVASTQSWGRRGRVTMNR